MNNHPKDCKCYGTGRWGKNGSEECPGSPTQAGWREELKRQMLIRGMNEKDAEYICGEMEIEFATARAEGAKEAIKYAVDCVRGGNEPTMTVIKRRIQAFK